MRTHRTQFTKRKYANVSVAQQDLERSSTKREVRGSSPFGNSIASGGSEMKEDRKEKFIRVAFLIKRMNSDREELRDLLKEIEEDEKNEEHRE